MYTCVCFLQVLNLSMAANTDHCYCAFVPYHTVLGDHSCPVGVSIFDDWSLMIKLEWWLVSRGQLSQNGSKWAIQASELW